MFEVWGAVERMGVVWAVIVTRVAGNELDDRSSILLASSCVVLRCLSSISLDETASFCVRSVHWAQAGLAVPPDEVVEQGWMAVIKFLQAGPCVALRELRLMLIGDGEVGKTSLSKAFADGRADRIPKEQRTVGIDLSELLFPAEDGADVTCQVCDFAGQEIYHLSHTLHFTRRCLYLLMWTTHKFSQSGAAIALAVGDVVGPLKCWLQLLAAHVPEANVVVVGTHCKVDPEAFKVMQERVDSALREEMERLRFIAEEEAKATRAILNDQTSKVCNLVREVEEKLLETNIALRAPQHDDSPLRHEEFLRAVAALSPHPPRSLLLKAEALLESARELSRTRLRLGRLHGVHDGSTPAASARVAHVKLVRAGSFAVDSVEGVGVAELLRAIEATCRDSEALPFMGEQVPVSWLQVKEALKLDVVRQRVGDCVVSVGEAAVRVRAALQQGQFDFDVEGARALPVEDVRSCLEFWSLLGRVFVYSGYFLRDVRFVIELLKPLVHHIVTGRAFLQEFCTGSFDGMDGCRLQLQRNAVLDHRLLSQFKAWAAASPEAQRSMMQFFKDSFMMSDLVHACSEGAECSLVTARLCDSSDTDRQREVASQAAAIEAASEFYAVYAVPRLHIGFIARMQATVVLLQSCHLEVSCGRDHICLERGGRMRCCVSVVRLEEVFQSKLGSLRELVPLDQYSHAISICSNDDGLFAFAARCVDRMMRGCDFGCMYQSWLPCRPLHCAQEGAAWRPRSGDWVLLEASAVPNTLFGMLSCNASDVVIPSRNLRLKDILPRKSPIFMSHTYSGDGTGEFCQRIKNMLQERLLCSVWFDKVEMGWGTTAFVDEMKRGMANASAFVICLSPLYLTRPNCLRELMWAMDMCAADKSKKLCVLPLHPSVSHAGCKGILDLAAAGCAAQVILPVDDRSNQAFTRLQQLRAHRLSDVAIQLLHRLIGPENVNLNADWMALQPWLSDAEGDNWEETSRQWADPSDGKPAVQLQQLLEGLCVDVQAAVLAACPPHPTSAFATVMDHELQSLPPSQMYSIPPDTTLLRAAFPQMLQSFDEADAVELMLLGLRDVDAVGCIVHGVRRDSLVSGRNPVDSVFRMAAKMSGVDFERARTQRQLQQQQQQELQQQQLHQRDVEDRRSRAFWRVVGVGGGVAAAALCALLLVGRRRR